MARGRFVYVVVGALAILALVLLSAPAADATNGPVLKAASTWLSTPCYLLVIVDDLTKHFFCGPTAAWAVPM